MFDTEQKRCYWVSKYRTRCIERMGCVNYLSRTADRRDGTMDSRRSDDRIRALATKAVGSSDGAEVRRLVAELRTELKEHEQKLKKIAAANPPFPYRRKTDSPSRSNGR